MELCKIERVSERADWEELFSRVAQPHLPQSWAWGDAVHASVNWELAHRAIDIGGWRPRRLVFERHGAPVAICQVAEKPVGRYRWAALVDRGPLFLDPEPDEEARRDVYATLRSARGHFGLILILVPALLDDRQNSALLTELGFRPRPFVGHRSSRVDLTVSEEDMFNNLTSRWRRQLRAGRLTGASVTFSSSPADVEWMMGRHIQNMKDKNFEWPEPPLVRALYNADPDNFMVGRVVLDGESLAGLAAFQFGQAAEYFVGWVSEPGRKLNVNSLLFWEAALEMRRRGSRSFDLGGLREGATEPFKKGMGGTTYQLTHTWRAF